MADDRTLGRVLHEARREHNPPRERPANVPPWDERAQWQRDLDEQMAADLGAVVEARTRERIAVDLERLARGAVPGVVRDAFLGARQVALHGLSERSDGKGPQS